MSRTSRSSRSEDSSASGCCGGVKQVDAFKASRTQAGVKASSINNELRVRTWSLEEVQRLYAAAQQVAPWLVPLLHFLLDTGCRKGEAIAAEWSWVHWQSRQLRIPVTDSWRPKDKDARGVPLSEALLKTLRSLPSACPYIFPNVHDVRYKTFPEKPFRKITVAAALLGGPHTTRHTYASHFLQHRPDLPLLASVLGHSQTRVTELYTHLLPGHLDRARNAVQLAPAQKPWRKTMAKGGGPQNHREKALCATSSAG